MKRYTYLYPSRGYFKGEWVCFKPPELGSKSIQIQIMYLTWSYVVFNGFAEMSLPNHYNILQQSDCGADDILWRMPLCLLLAK